MLKKLKNLGGCLLNNSPKLKAVVLILITLKLRISRIYKSE